MQIYPPKKKKKTIGKKKMQVLSFFFFFLLRFLKKRMQICMYDFNIQRKLTTEAFFPIVGVSISK